MHEIKEPRCTQWNADINGDYSYTKKVILSVLKDQKVSLSRARALFSHILDEIEDNNPVTF